MPTYKTISIEPIDEGAILWLNRPQIKNAISELVISELADYFTSNSSDLRFVVMAGKGDCFAAGADLKEMYSVTEEKAIEISTRLHELLKTIQAFPVPVVAAIHGYAIGGGFELALAADIIFATHNSFFSLPELNYDMIPGGGATQRLPQKIGSANAFYYILSGESITAQQCKDYGVIQKLFDEQNFIPEVLSELKKMLGNKDTEAIAILKDVISNAGSDEGYKKEAKGFAKLLTQKAKIHIEKFIKKNSSNK
jgi:enoyl-CoA hydratase/carnithine racemase